MGKHARSKPSIIQRKKRKLEVDLSETHPIPDVDEELNKNLIVHGGIAHKAPESVILKLPIEREVELVPEESTETECYPCPYCNKLYLTHTGLEKHGVHEHNDRMPEIMILIQRIQKIWAYFNQTPGLRSRILDRSGSTMALKSTRLPEEPVDDICRRCGTVFDMTKLDFINVHKKMHDANDKFKERLHRKYGKIYTASLNCELCDIVCINMNILAHHNLIAHPENKSDGYKCDVCSTMLDSNDSLLEHLSAVHSITAPLLRFGVLVIEQGMPIVCNQCTECGDVFDKLRTLHAHVRTAHGLNSPFDGEFCQDGRRMRLSCRVTEDSLQTSAICCSQRLSVSEFALHNQNFHKK